MDIQEWMTQARRGVLEYSILLLIQKKAMYGYDLIASLNKWESLCIAPGTIYPLLKRLEKEGLLQYSWENSQEGLPPKKYYLLTPFGEKLLDEMDGEWGKIVNAVQEIKNLKI